MRWILKTVRREALENGAPPHTSSPAAVLRAAHSYLRVEEVKMPLKSIAQALRQRSATPADARRVIAGTLRRECAAQPTTAV